MFFKKSKAQEPQQSQGMTEEQARGLVSQIPEFAEAHRKVAQSSCGMELDYSADSIPMLDEIINRWPKLSPEQVSKMVVTFGSYFGESVRHIHGGNWCFSPELGLYLDVGDLGIKIFPFDKMRKRLLNGEEDSLEFFYSVISAEVEKKRTA